MKTTKDITVTKTTAILGAAAVILGIAGTAVVSTNTTISAVNDKAALIAQQQTLNENVVRQHLHVSDKQTAQMIDFNRVMYRYEQVSITYANHDGTPLTEGEFTTEIRDDGLYLVASGVPSGYYRVILHADDLYPSQLSGDIFFDVQAFE